MAAASGHGGEQALITKGSEDENNAYCFFMLGNSFENWWR